jgi:predicted nucleic-acid-binding protein
MIGIDTNVLVRYIVQDDPIQSRISTDFIENNCSVSSPGVINLIVLCELVWVLRRAYEFKKEIIVEVIKQILTTKEFIVHNSENAWKALNEFSNGKADFSDYIIGYVNKDVGCEFTITFDKFAAENKYFKLLNY